MHCKTMKNNKIKRSVLAQTITATVPMYEQFRRDRAILQCLREKDNAL